MFVPSPPETHAGAGSPALVAVAHGSRDPRSAATVAALIDEVRHQRPELDVRLSFLDLSAPRLGDVLAGVAADGHRRAVVVPLLLGNAFHARVDVPGVVNRAARRYPKLRITVADVLGGDPRLTDAALRRLAEVTELADPGLGVLLTATGSSHRDANTEVRRQAAALATRHPWRASVAAFATAASPTVREGIAQLRAHGAERIAVASWFLAPGLLPTRVTDAALATEPAVRIAPPLGADPAVAEVILARYRSAAEPNGRRTAG